MCYNWGRGEKLIDVWKEVVRGSWVYNGGMWGLAGGSVVTYISCLEEPHLPVILPSLPSINTELGGKSHP